MKRFRSYGIVLLISLLLVACQQDKETNEDSVKSEEKTKETVHDKTVYKANEEAFITDANGGKIYSIVINSVKNVKLENDDKEFIPNDSKQTVVVDYTYKYINENEDLTGLEISPSDLIVYDDSNIAGSLVDVGASYYPFDSENPEILAGRSAETYAVYSLKKNSSKVQIDFSSPTFKQNLTFELAIEK